MDAVGVVLMGFGAYLMYEAYKNKTPMPIAKATQTVKQTTPLQ
jgi:hypothetical protein